MVVGIDGSTTSDLATAIAFDQASRRGVDLVALHAWSDMGPIEFASANWAPIEWRNIKDAEQEVLSERLAGYSQRYPDVTVHKIVVSDRPGPRLVEKAREAQLLVLGSHGRGGSRACCWARSATPLSIQPRYRSSSPGCRDCRTAPLSYVLLQ